MVSLLSEKHRTAFVHIPKCAGTTVTRALLRLGAHKDKTQNDWQSSHEVPGIPEAIASNILPAAREKVYDGHARARDFLHVLGPEKWANFRSFAITRNPWERLLSTYHFIRRDGNSTISMMMRAMTFVDFIEWHCRTASAPQFDWLHDAQGALLVDEVVSVDQLNDFLERRVEEIYDVRETFAPENPSDARLVSLEEVFSYVPQETIDLFTRVYARDFTFLGLDPVPPGGKWQGPVFEMGAFSIGKSGLPFDDDQVSLLGAEGVNSVLARSIRSAHIRARLETDKLKSDNLALQKQVNQLRAKIVEIKKDGMN